MGIVLNNQMDDFVALGVPNFLVWSEPVRMRTQQETLVEYVAQILRRNNKAVVIVGASGDPPSSQVPYRRS